MPKGFKLFIGHHQSDFLHAVRERLQPMYAIRTSSDGDEILNTMTQLTPDLAILDYDIPEIDIIELCAKFNKDQPHVNTVIYVCDRDLAVAKKKWRKRAMDYIVGPLDVEEYCENVNKVVRYILLNREREALMRSKVELHYLINKKIDTVKNLIEEIKKDRRWDKLDLLENEIAQLYNRMKEIERYHM